MHRRSHRDEEPLALYDLLLKSELDREDIERLKVVAMGLHEALEAEVTRVQDFYAKQATRDAMKTRIHDYLYDEKSGLPESFELDEIDIKAEAVFAHIMMASRLEMAASDST